MTARSVARWPFIAVVAVLAASQLLTDRIGWLQSLWWTPRVILVAASLSGLLLVLCVGWIRRWGRGEQLRTLAWIGAAAALGAWSLWGEWGFRRSRDPEAFRFAFWNACWMRREVAPLAVDMILSWNADAVLLTDPGSTFANGGAERLAEAGYQIAQPGSFAIVSRVPIVEATPLHEARGQKLARIRLATPRGPLVIDAIDLPSETTLHRELVTRNFAAAIEGMRDGMPDIVAGDFNITRGSASLRAVVGNAVEAFAAAGEGWGGTYPRAWPLFAIDQTYVRAPWRAAWSRIVDPGLTRHRAQLVDLLR